MYTLKSYYQEQDDARPKNVIYALKSHYYDDDVLPATSGSPQKLSDEAINGFIQSTNSVKPKEEAPKANDGKKKSRTPNKSEDNKHKENEAPNEIKPLLLPKNAPKWSAELERRQDNLIERLESLLQQVSISATGRSRFYSQEALAAIEVEALRARNAVDFPICLPASKSRWFCQVHKCLVDFLGAPLLVRQYLHSSLPQNLNVSSLLGDIERYNAEGAFPTFYVSLLWMHGDLISFDSSAEIDKISSLLKLDEGKVKILKAFH